MLDPIHVNSDCLSTAWAEAFGHAMAPGKTPPMLVQIGTPKGEAEDIEAMRATLDTALVESGQSTIATVANTIFPWSLWNPDRPRDELFQRYETIWPRIKRDRANRYGVYFQRLIAYPSFGDGAMNQLDYIIETYSGYENHRHSALQASIIHPPSDDTNQRQRGFPCLQQVSFDVTKNGLTVVAFYPKQNVFEKAYGNYLGLCRLGEFMAAELGKTLEGLQCFVGHPEYAGKPTKGSLAGLRNTVRELAGLGGQDA
jgi:hypothetical protein